MTQTPDRASATDDQQEGVQEFTILVAVAVRGHDRQSAERALHEALPRPGEGRGALVECWWIAEDDRRDGSDCDSATFVTKGSQDHGAALLADHGLAGRTP